MKSQGGADRNAGHLIGLHILPLAAALDDGAEVIEHIAARLAILQPVARDVLEGVIEKALEDVVHDESPARCPAAELIAGTARGGLLLLLCWERWPAEAVEAAQWQG